MAKFVVAGRSDCPYYARAELLGDRLAKNLEMFHLHKIMVQPNEWDGDGGRYDDFVDAIFVNVYEWKHKTWLQDTCTEKGWNHTKSPIIWRELIDRGGKGVLIGGANEFQEYVKAYYDLESEMNSYDMRTNAQENKVTKDELDEEDRVYKALSKPVHVCVTNAASPITYHLLNSISSGNVLGSNVEVTIRLLVSSPGEADSVKGTAMEVEDLAHPLMREVKVCTNPQEAFKNCSIVILLDELLQNPEEKKKEWLERNNDFFSKYATIINSVALASCKVLLCGLGPLNFNAMTMIQGAPNLHRQNIVALSTISENNAKSVVGERLVVNPAGIVDLLVWGNINGNKYFDVKKCRVHNYDGAIWGPYWYSVDAMEMIHDNKWIIKEFPGLVHGRSEKVSEAMKHSTCMSAGNAICTTLRYWCQGSPQGQLFSLGVYSEGWYGVPEGLVFSYPVTMDPKGYWHVAQDIELTPELKQAIADSVEDLNKEQGIFRGEIEEEIKDEDKKPEESADTETKTPAGGEEAVTEAPTSAPVVGEVGESKAGDSTEKPDTAPTVPAIVEENGDGESNEAQPITSGEAMSEEKPTDETEGENVPAPEATTES